MFEVLTNLQFQSGYDDGIEMVKATLLLSLIIIIKII
jgi:hypothetical protein